MTRRARLLSDECAACGRSDLPLSVHHVVFGANRRDDDARGWLVLCGDGVRGCHGLLHAADEDTRRRIGEAIAARPEMMLYVTERLGEEQGRDYLRRRYFLAEASDG